MQPTFRASAIMVCLMAISACATSGETTARAAFENRTQRLQGDQSTSEADSKTAALDGTLNSYVRFAMQNSPELEAQFQRWRASIQRISASRRLPDPVLSYSYYISRVETRVGPQRQRLSLVQSFPWPTKLSAGADAASSRARSQGERFDALAISLTAQVEEKYWTLWALVETVKIHREHLIVLTGLSESASALVATGRVDLSDQQQIDLTTAKIEDLIATIDENIGQAQAALKGVIGAPQSIETPVTSEPMLVPPITGEDALMESAKSHPLIAAYESLALSAEADARKERASRYPNFSLGVDWIETGEARMDGVKDSGKDAVMIGMGISLPLWQTNYKQNIEASRSDSRAFRADGRAAVNVAIARLRAALSRVRDMRRRIQLYEDTLLPGAQSVFESVVIAYTSGRGSVASTLLAQEDLLNLRIELTEVRADYARSLSALESIVGKPINRQLEQRHQEEIPQ